MKKVLVITTCTDAVQTKSFLSLLHQEDVVVSLVLIHANFCPPIGVGVYANLKQALLCEQADFFYFFDDATLSPNAFFHLIAYADTFGSDFVACGISSEKNYYLTETTGTSFYCIRSTLVEQIEQHLAYTTANKLYRTAFVNSHLAFLTNEGALSFSPATFCLRSFAKATVVSTNATILCQKEQMIPTNLLSLSLPQQLDWIYTTMKNEDGIFYSSVCVVALTNALFLNPEQDFCDFASKVTTLIGYHPFISCIEALQSDSYPFSKIFSKTAAIINLEDDSYDVDSSYLNNIVRYTQYFADNAPLLAQQCLIRFLYSPENIHHFGLYTLKQLHTLFPKELSNIYAFMEKTNTQKITDSATLANCYLPFLNTPDRVYVLSILFAVYTISNFSTDALDILYLLLAMPDTQQLDYYLNLYQKLARNMSDYELALANFLSKNKQILIHIANKKYDDALCALNDSYNTALGSIPKNILSARIYWWAGMKSDSIDLFVNTLFLAENKDRYPYNEVHMLIKQTGNTELLETLEQILNQLRGGSL